MNESEFAGGGAAVVPAISVASSVACLRSLGRRGVRTLAVSEKATPPAFASKYCDERASVPDPEENLDSYGDALVALAERPDVRTVVPFREADVYALARNRDTLGEHVGTPWPTMETLRKVQDRVKLFEEAAAAGVGYPETATLDEWVDWDRETIVKSRYTVLAPEYVEERSESGVSDASTVYLAPGEEPNRSEIRAEMGHVPIVQEYVPQSDEYGFFAIYDCGEPMATFQHRQRRGWKYAGGPSAYRESVRIPELEAAGRNLLNRLDWHGVAMVEFLRDERTGEFELMEVNPRFWSSLPFTVQAGVDFPYLYWLQATDRSRFAEAASEATYTAGIGGHLLRGELLYLHSVLFEEYNLVERPRFADAVADVASSLVRDPRFDYLSADDPMPFVRDVRNLLGSAAEWGRSALRRSREEVVDAPSTDRRLSLWR
ncbi:carboxylate--amine ligase [Halopelagius longus]|uniref:Predicted ATP-dependent carboligase, ATP-grasp superfamily n=1 Tax=Halopelagius longus TaxID=1236180 RepID=A0A1H0Y4I9_9EURY|nr:carboxylate--amine ligase [Halopelagius longus]SDQ09876.1 Predicted ATP-dependent carboligase, ATP-grasp superfamily [Halopelagius longus]